jgi:hypothetical protein
VSGDRGQSGFGSDGEITERREKAGNVWICGRLPDHDGVKEAGLRGSQKLSADANNTSGAFLQLTRSPTKEASDRRALV